MLRNYLKIAWRNLRRNKLFSILTISGLALGITCSLLIGLWVRDEMSINRYHQNGPFLYRVMQRQLYDGKRVAQSSNPGILVQELTKKFPEVAYAAGFSAEEQMTFSVGNQINKETGRFAGADWFRMFSVPLLQGTSQSALNAPTKLVLSRKLAQNYFGSVEAAIGKLVRLDDQTDYLVTAVFEDLPKNTSEKYDFLLSWDDYLIRNPWAKEWGNNGPKTLVQLRPDANRTTFEAKLLHFLRGYDKAIVPGRFDAELFLQPYEDIYLHSETENGEIAGGRIEYVRLFSIVALFLLLIACINFMNLATARSVKRAKEVGVRKVVGAERARLIGQFVGEALLLTSLAVGVAVVIVALLLPSFNNLTGKQVTLPVFEPVFWLALLSLTVVTGTVAGSYPAFFMSSLNPVRVLKGALKFQPGATRFRQGLVVFQFVLSTLLIVGTVVVYKQMAFIQTKNLGYNRENLIYVPLEGELTAKFATLRAELTQKPGIQAISATGEGPTQIGSSTSGVNWPGKDPNVNIEFFQTGVGYDAVKTLRATLVAGRDFSPAFGTDSSNYLINETAAKRIGYKDRIGQSLTVWNRPGKIVGVIRDFHFQSLHETIQPLILRLSEASPQGSLLVRTQPGQTKQALASLESVCRQLNPKFPFTYYFSDDEYQKMYRSETVISQLANYFAFLAIFISCLGLFGLTAFTAEQRTKEIGVRKVLGASVGSIIGLLSGDFLKLVFVAILVASPVAWYALNRWLQNFEYHIAISGWVFALSGLLAIGIALLTVSFQSVKAALTNPVKSLRSE